MGVMSCSRKGCNNILCDTYINSIGYICNECKEEFKAWLKRNNHNPKNNVEAIYCLEVFTDTYKGSTIDDPDFSIDKFLE